MKDCYLKARAYVDWLEFKEIVEDMHCSLERLCAAYNGHNLETSQRRFDCNYKSICCTVIEMNEGCFTLTDSVEVWNDEECTLIGDYLISELEVYVKEEEE